MSVFGDVRGIFCVHILLFSIAKCGGKYTAFTIEFNISKTEDERLVGWWDRKVGALDRFANIAGERSIDHEELAGSNVSHLVNKPVKHRNSLSKYYRATKRAEG